MIKSSAPDMMNMLAGLLSGETESLAAACEEQELSPHEALLAMAEHGFGDDPDDNENAKQLKQLRKAADLFFEIELRRARLLAAQKFGDLAAGKGIPDEISSSEMRALELVRRCCVSLVRLNHNTVMSAPRAARSARSNSPPSRYQNDITSNGSGAHTEPAMSQERLIPSIDFMREERRKTDKDGKDSGTVCPACVEGTSVYNNSDSEQRQASKMMEATKRKARKTLEGYGITAEMLDTYAELRANSSTPETIKCSEIPEISEALGLSKEPNHTAFSLTNSVDDLGQGIGSNLGCEILAGSFHNRPPP